VEWRRYVFPCFLCTLFARRTNVERARTARSLIFGVREGFIRRTWRGTTSPAGHLHGASERRKCPNPAYITHRRSTFFEELWVLLSLFSGLSTSRPGTRDSDRSTRNSISPGTQHSGLQRPGHLMGGTNQVATLSGANAIGSGTGSGHNGERKWLRSALGCFHV
jgi:hypothetical protein